METSMRTISLQHGRLQAADLPGPITVFGALLGWLWKSHERARQDYAAADLDDRMRRDVGLARSAAPSALPIYLVR